MISLDKFKKLLGEAGNGLTDQEIEKIRTADYQLADALFDIILRERNSFPYPIFAEKKYPKSCIISSKLISSGQLFFFIQPCILFA